MNANGHGARLDDGSRNLAMLVWILTIPFGILPSLIVYFAKRGDVFVRRQAAEALTWAITLIAAYIGAFALTMIFHSMLFRGVGFLLFIVLAVSNLVFCIRGAIASGSGRDFRVPFAIRLLG